MTKIENGRGNITTDEQKLRGGEGGGKIKGSQIFFFQKKKCTYLYHTQRMTESNGKMLTSEESG